MASRAPRRRLPPAPLAAAVAVTLAGALAAPARATDVRYRLVHVPAGCAEAEAGACWTVELTLTDADRRDGRLVVALDGFGGWADLAHPYLRDVTAEPAPRSADAAAGRFVFDVPRGDDATVRLAYRIPLLAMHGKASRARGLLPAGGPDYAFGWSWNVLPQVSDDDGPVRGRRTLELRAPEGTELVTGFGGRARDTQTVALDPAMGNGPIAFGTPAHAARRQAGALAIEVVQFGAGSDVSDVVADVLAAATPGLERRFGTPARSPYRAFVTDHQGGGMGSHHGLRIAHTADEPPERRDDPWLVAFVLHEHVHDWLGLTLTDEGEALVWFKEGFTEYLSQWAAVASGLVPREYFARRLLELEQIARTRSALGEVRFGDPNVSWRDGDGPVETLAYTGAPLLAFLADVELRERGKPGLTALVAALVADGPRTIDRRDVKAAFTSAGIATLWKRSVDGTDLPPCEALLRRAGFARVEREVDLAYLGLRADGEHLGARVVEVDPDGPAAAAGLRVGDVVTGGFPFRETPARVPGRAPRCDYLLARMLPGEPDSYLGVRRGDEDLKLGIVPDVLPAAGRVETWATDTPELDAFFAFGP